MQLDTLNEKILDVPTNGITGGAEVIILQILRASTSKTLFLFNCNLICVIMFVMQEIYHKQVPNLTDVFKAVPFKPLIGLLEHHGLLTER